MSNLKVSEVKAEVRGDGQRAREGSRGGLPAERRVRAQEDGLTPEQWQCECWAHARHGVVTRKPRPGTEG